MEEKVKIPPILSDDADLAYFPGIGLVVNLMDKPAQKPKTPIEIVTNTYPYVFWGDDNNYPDYVAGKAEINDLIPAVIDFKSNHLAAQQINYGISKGFDKNNKEIFERIIHPDIEEFFQFSDKQLFVEDYLRNLFGYHLAFTDLYQNKQKTYITALSAHDTGDVRYDKQNPLTGVKEWVYIDANFPMRASEKTWEKVRCLDPYWDVQGQLANIPVNRFVYPSFFNSSRRKYYPRAPWHSIIDSYWLDVATKIPKFKAKLMDNQMTISWVIHVPRDWWSWKYPKFEQMTEQDKKNARQETLKDFNDTLTGIDAAGKTLMMDYKSDPYNQNKFTKWEVQQFSGKLGDGAYVEDSQEASDHILFALAFDGSLIGKTPGKGMGAGSGSDKRLADEIFFKNNRPYILKVIKIFEIITTFNRWKGPNGEKICWFQEQEILTTLNNVPPDSRPGG